MKFEIHFEFRASLRKFQDLNFWDATTSASKDRLDLDLGGASTSPNLGLGPTTSQEAPSLPYPKLTQATGNKTGVPSGSLRQTSNDGASHAL
jgi:carbohydrate-binding DOMON domain-containing protein